ncbi:MAG TPA: trehalose-phosphatase, partial [Gemmatimonadales bacterium]|nr:trehalose-phosphatase [Gemmatimonadales bacterium]
MRLLPDPAWAYFLDVDGTLVDLVPRPAEARPSVGARRLLEVLHQRTAGALALVSGRSLNQLDALLPGFRPAAAGLHGLERRDAAGHRAEVPGSTTD